jgi:hypothetical protein
MTNQIGIYDHESGEQIVREMTAEEALQSDADAKAYADAKAALNADKATQATEKAALLERLGITAEEATLLLG